MKLAIISLLLLIPVHSVVAEPQLPACQELQEVNESMDSIQKRNQFLSVKNPRSAQAPEKINETRESLVEKCRMQIAEAKQNNREFAQPDLEKLLNEKPAQK
jgi:hypothetical protein